LVLSSTPIVPATWLPCPLSSSALSPIEQFLAIAAVGLRSASERLIPVGVVCAVVWTWRSRCSYETRGSAASAVVAAAGTCAE
ncbi:MAG: hypothetical protein M3386_01040, partial [Actinomycetota bacterium]|nr:hypothetical protein [Actinomycetota bacterium]